MAVPGWVLAGLATVVLTTGAPAQGPPSPPAIPVLERLVGHWTMNGTVRGRAATYRLDAGWVLQRRFVELHMVDSEHIPAQYEARVFIGPDTAQGRLIAHWLDAFGAAYSVPAATGTAEGDSLTLDFPYVEGAFHDTFVYDAAADRWTMRLDAADGKGGWTRFAEYRAARR